MYHYILFSGLKIGSSSQFSCVLNFSLLATFITSFLINQLSKIFRFSQNTVIIICLDVGYESLYNLTLYKNYFVPKLVGIYLYKILPAFFCSAQHEPKYFIEIGAAV